MEMRAGPTVEEESNHVARQRALSVERLKAGYPDTSGINPFGYSVVINGVELQVEAGEIVGIQGANASGKSTLLSAIVDPKRRLSGSVKSGDSELQTGETAYMPQAAAETLSPWLTVGEEVALPLRIDGVSEKEQRKRVQELMSRYRIELPLDRRVHALSGGQRVKVALLRSFAVQRMRLFVLDEPFEGLDSESRHVVLASIQRVANRGVPVLLTSHREEDLRALNARMLRLRGSPVDRIVPVSSRPMTIEAGTDRGQSAAGTQRRGSGSFALGSENLKKDDANDALSQMSAEVRPDSESDGFGALRIGGIALGFGVWKLAAAAVGDPGLLPGPLSVGEEAIRLLFDTERFPHFGATMSRALSGWLLANLTAIPIGILLGYDKRIYSAASPWLSLGRTLPVFVLLGPAIGLFPGYSELQRGFLIWLTLYLISIQSVSAAAAFASRIRLRIARIFGADHWFRLKNVLFHESLGGIFSALEITLPLAVIVSLVVEIFLIPQVGLGVYIYNNLTSGDISTLFAHILLPGVAAAVGMWGLRKIGSRTVAMT